MLSDTSVSSLFYLSAAIFCLILFCLKGSKEWRQIVLGAFGLIVVVAQSSGFEQLLLVFSFPSFSFLLILLISRYRDTAVLVAASIVLLGAFVVVKQYWFVPEVPALQLFLTVGLSYMLFRAIHVCVEVSNGLEFKVTDIAQYLRYQLSPFNFFAGPINNYEDYLDDEDSLGELSITRDYFARGLLRILLGLIKIVAVSQLLMSLFLVLKSSGDLYYVPAAVTFIAYIYANFSGYMDVVIGVGKLFGINVPENFDRPWMAHNFSNFWSRWHITLSFFFRDYLFFPALKYFSRFTRSKLQMTFCGALLSFVAFFLLGVWHGTTYMFIYLGIALGAGVGVNYFCSALMQKKISGEESEQGLAEHFIGSLAIIYFGVVSTLVWPEVNDLAKALELSSAFLSVDGMLGLFFTVLGISALRVLTLMLDNTRSFFRSLNWLTPLVISILLLTNYFLYKISASSPPPHIYYEDF